jgi:hypothetical protein
VTRKPSAPRRGASRAPDKALLRAAYVSAVRRYYGRDDVDGIAVGRAYKRGVAETHPGVRVHVREKFARTSVPKHLLFPRSFEGARLDVTDGHFVDDACASFAERIGLSQLIQPGLSVGRRHGPAGTIGALAEDDQGRRFIVGAGHVFVGDDSDPGDDLFQPAEEDGQGQRIAALARYSRHHDMAVAEIDSDRMLRPRPIEETESFKGLALPYQGQLLRKSARSTCCTRAMVDAVGAFGPIQRALWLRPLEGEPDDCRICQGGDSGSVWFDPDTMLAVGLHVKGENVLGSRAIAVQLASDPDEQYVGALDMWGLSIL